MSEMELSQKILLFIPSYLILLFSIICHECAHAYTAKKLGDHTSEQFVSFNPVPHILRSPFGLVVIPIVFFLLSDNGGMIGFASVPVNAMWAQRFPKKDALVSLSGPVANFIICAISIIALVVLLRSGVEFTSISSIESVGQGLFYMAITAFSLNLLLGFFNLIPVPPLDGCYVPLLFIPEASRRSYMNIIWNPSMSMPGILIAWLVFPGVATNIIYPVERFSYGVIDFLVNI